MTTVEVEVDLAQEIGIEDVPDPGHVNDQENNRLLKIVVIKIEIAIGTEIEIGTATEIVFETDDRYKNCFNFSRIFFLNLMG